MAPNYHLKSDTFSMIFQKHERLRAFFSKFDVKLEVYFNYCGRSFDQAATLSLRGPAQFTHEARSAEFDGTVGTGGTGWTDGTVIKSVL